MNLLVTGGAGFIGSHFIRQILDAPEIAKLVNLDCLTYAGNLANLEGADRHPRYVFEKVDLRDRGEVLRVVREHSITHVIHLAAESHVDRSIAAPDDFVQTNVVGTFHLLEACREVWSGKAGSAASNGVRFLQVSTDEVYGSLGPTDPPFQESSPISPNSPYSASKAAADHFVSAYHHTYDLPTAISRCSNNYGPFQHPEKFIPVVIRSILNRQPIPLYGDGLNIRDWLHVEDHCRALWLILNRGLAGEVYNIGGGNEWANLHLVERLCDLMNELCPSGGKNSQELIGFVVDRAGHDRRYAINADKAVRDLGWKLQSTFELGLREAVSWHASYCQSEINPHAE